MNLVAAEESMLGGKNRALRYFKRSMLKFSPYLFVSLDF